MDAELCDLVAHHWSMHGKATPLLGGGDECVIWHLRGSLDAVVRVSPSWRSKGELRWAFTVANLLRRHVSEVIVPLRTGNGEPVVLWRDRPVSVWPFVDGFALDRDNPRQRQEAARLLASLHCTALSIGPLAPRPPSRRTVHTASVDDILSDQRLDAQLHEWRTALAADRPRGPLHGDFYRRNLLCRSDKIVGLLDWDDARDDYLETELAWSVWEFAKTPVDEWSPDRAAGFLRTYVAEGGPVRPSRHLVPLIRAALRHEVREARACHIRGGPIDEEYHNREVAAFWQLRGVELSP